MQKAGLPHVLGEHTNGVPAEVAQQPDQQAAFAPEGQAHCHAPPTWTQPFAPQLIPHTPQCSGEFIWLGTPPQHR